MTMNEQQLGDLAEILKTIPKCKDLSYNDIITPQSSQILPFIPPFEPPVVSSLLIRVNEKHYPVVVVEMKGQILNHDMDYDKIVSCLRDIQGGDVHLVLDMKRVTHVNTKIVTDLVQAFASWQSPFVQSFCLLPPRLNDAKTAVMVAKSVFGFTRKAEWFNDTPATIVEHNKEVDHFLKGIRGL